MAYMQLLPFLAELMIVTSENLEYSGCESLVMLQTQ